MRWIREHRLLSAIIAILLIAFILLFVSVRNGGASGIGVLNRLYMTIEKPFSTLGSSIKRNVSGVFSYRDLIKENEALKEENDRLRNEMSQMTLHHLTHYLCLTCYHKSGYHPSYQPAARVP